MSALKLLDIASKLTVFPTVLLPEAGEMTPYLYFCADWNLLVETEMNLKYIILLCILTCIK